MAKDKDIEKERVARRLHITLPQGYREDLDTMAQEVGETSTAYAGYLIRLKIEEWRKEKKAIQNLIKAEERYQEAKSQLATIVGYIKYLLGNESEIDFKQISDLSGIPAEQLEALYHEATGQDFETSVVDEEKEEGCHKKQ